MKLNLSSAALCAALAALAVAGCGGDDDSSGDSASSSQPETTAEKAPAPAPTPTTSGGGGASTNLQIAADESGKLLFDKDKLSAKAGNVTIVMDNPSPVPHAVGIKGSGLDEDGETVGMGEKSTVTADLKPGEYEFYCPVDGHEAAGMKGTLTVK
jgi:plastocyanin